MKSFFVPILLIPICMLLFSVSDRDAVQNCEVIPLHPQTISGHYPAHRLSPEEAEQHYNTIFVGEVVVPARRCSLGYCAGIKVTTPMKGVKEKNFLVRISKADRNCGPSKFHHKGISWLVFGNYGTSKLGQSYLEVEDDGPSFETQRAPTFSALQKNYRTLQSYLDQAIKNSLPPQKETARY